MIRTLCLPLRSPPRCRRPCRGRAQPPSRRPADRCRRASPCTSCSTTNGSAACARIPENASYQRRQALQRPLDRHQPGRDRRRAGRRTARRWSNCTRSTARRCRPPTSSTTTSSRGSSSSAVERQKFREYLQPVSHQGGVQTADGIAEVLPFASTQGLPRLAQAHGGAAGAGRADHRADARRRRRPATCRRRC